ncbi:hypothetical protein [Altericroceibacterium endophyticum]|uniref:hypothetical protein n=1 Tax=Altericroceibacterium endophyticum TaxID=1808508 RepID=UPI001371115F|nr:hypothetical protein [Altericroceibacterium endophyticum]
MRELVRELRGRTDALKISAREYWLGPDPKLRALKASKLKSEIQSLSRHLRVLREVGISFDDQDLIEIRQLATGAPFEERGWRRSAAVYDRITDLSNSIEELLEAIDISFYEIFPPHRRRNWWQVSIPVLLLFCL